MEWGDCDPKVLLHDEQSPMRFETTPEKEAALPSQGLSVEERNSWPIFLTKQEGK